MTLGKQSAAAFIDTVFGWISNATTRKVEITLSLVAVFLVGRAIRYYQGLRTVNNVPCFRVGFTPLSVAGLLLPRTWWNPKILGFWLERATLYKRFGTDTISIVPFIYGSPILCTSNLEVARQVLSGGPKASFTKPFVGNSAVSFLGINVFSASGETWRKHRRVVSPCFNNALYTYIFDESIALYRDMIASEKWMDQNETNVSVLQDLVHKFTLLAILKCGFGVPFSWSAPPEANDGSMSIQQAIQLVSQNFLAVLFASRRSRISDAKVRAACQQIEDFMEAQVEQRRALIQSSTGAELAIDIFTTLVRANEDEDAKYKLDNQELIGNVFVMLVGGNDTTASALAATIAFLAWHQDIQGEVVEQIKSVVGYDRDPNFEDYSKLNKVLSVFLEAIRMFPPSYLSMRQSIEDTVLKIPSPVDRDGSTTIPIPKGMMVIVETVGLQYNPRYYDEPEKYKPSRWYDTENLESELFTGFGVGPRACIGRKFAAMEAVAFLTMLLRDWRVEPYLQHGENKEEWRERVFDARISLILSIKNVPVKFMRRQ